MRRSAVIVGQQKYRIPALVGGARKTCMVKSEGFSKSAREIAEYYVTERRDRFLAALKIGRDGYLVKSGREYVTFELVDDLDEMEANILAAMQNFIHGVFSTRGVRTLPRGMAHMLASQ